MTPKNPVPDLIRDGRRFSRTNDFVHPEITPCNKARQRITDTDFYRSYMTLRSMRR